MTPTFTNYFKFNRNISNYYKSNCNMSNYINSINNYNNYSYLNCSNRYNPINSINTGYNLSNHQWWATTTTIPDITITIKCSLISGGHYNSTITLTSNPTARTSPTTCPLALLSIFKVVRACLVLNDHDVWYPTATIYHQSPMVHTIQLLQILIIVQLQFHG